MNKLKTAIIILLPVLALVLFVIINSSCGGIKTVQIWTDRPEMAFYGELFNSAQTQVKVSVRYFDNPGMEFAKSGNTADVIIGSRLKNASTGNHFRSLDNLFGANKLSRSIFYQQLLATGRIDRNQYLLPVSFNIPALIFSNEREMELSNSYTINFNEIKALSRTFNAENSGTYTRIGFSPLWNDEFLWTVSVLFNSGFREASPLAWDTASLERAIEFIKSWTNEINSNIRAEEDFMFKYFIEPPQRLIQNERILFSYIDSRDFFTFNEDTMNSLEYRWIMEENRIPIIEDMVFIGIPKKAKAVKAARAFILWFFNSDNQSEILEYCMYNRISQNAFGICGGFSSITQVTEQVFPRYYPKLIGRMPPSDYLLPPNEFPGNWAEIKSRVVLPYLHNSSRAADTEDVYPLERRLADWIRINR